jgi:hypothetical protein
VNKNLCKTVKPFAFVPRSDPDHLRDLEKRIGVLEASQAASDARRDLLLEEVRGTRKDIEELIALIRDCKCDG